MNESLRKTSIGREWSFSFSAGKSATSKDADLGSMNDYISAYAQVEHLQSDYDQKLQKYSKLYSLARKRDSDRGIFNIERFRGKYHPETWENMTEIIDLVRQINELTKRQTAVIHVMASLPEPERVKFWHEQFAPPAAEEHALREKLRVVGQGTPPGGRVQ